MEHVLTGGHVAAPATPQAAQGPRIRTWHLFAALVAASAVLMWVNKEFVMTREVYHAILGEQLEARRIDEQFDMLKQSAQWGYVFVPLITWVRLALVALLLQLFLLLFLAEVPLGKLFRAAAWAFPAMLYGMAVRMVMLMRLDPAAITKEQLSRMPGSVADMVPSLSEPGTPLYSLLSLVSFWEALWCGILFYALRKGAPKVSGLVAGAAVAGVWLVIVLFQWGITLYLTGVQ
jgi:hypothetical protein